MDQSQRMEFCHQLNLQFNLPIVQISIFLLFPGSLVQTFKYAFLKEKQHFDKPYHAEIGKKISKS